MMKTNLLDIIYFTIVAAKIQTYSQSAKFYTGKACKYDFISTFAARMRRFTAILTTILTVMLLLTGCQKMGKRLGDELPEGNAVYYWRTDLRLDSTEQTFLYTYNINKVYCRYFDVVMKEGATEPTPNATIEFSDSLPDSLEIIPTVYITEDCMHQSHPGLAEKIVRRILQMNETNGINHIREIQIDCDYTSRSRKTYYEFLEDIGKQCEPFGLQLSATIRLHQLSMVPPPVDYGVLMIYNTGNPATWEERNPLLDIRDVAPYLKRLDGYPLPLAAAYPVYLWVRNIQGLRVEHSVEADEILRVKQAVEEARHDLSRAIITYHLDKDNINRYNPKTYEEIYHH